MRSEHLANLALASARPSWQDPAPRRVIVKRTMLQRIIALLKGKK